MTEAARKVLEDALSLPEEQRMDLLVALSDSLEPSAVDLSPAWKAELEDRIAQVERGEVELVSWNQVESRIRETLTRRP